MTEKFVLGQRWISETEPELGLGSVEGLTAHTVSVVFKGVNERREYARDNAPLRRVRFRAGDIVKHRNGDAHQVDQVLEQGGLIVYQTDKGSLSERELSETISFNKPEERLFAGQLDEPSLFDLRFSALQHQYTRRKSSVRGFVGGRIDLIPHQLFIASQIADRLHPRVLLADEVGLGKTIEACLILHRLIITGRVQRALILVPESLVHQWFVELLRRFNLWFHIFDEERCSAIEGSNPDENPFLDDQFVLATVGLFTRNERRLNQALAAGWDLLIVDEAHHLAWSPEQVSVDYHVVEKLGQRTPSLLLLTATPEQLGLQSHFARLRLLDPNRFHDLQAFLKESADYRQIAQMADRLLENQLTDVDVTSLGGILNEGADRARVWVEASRHGDETARDAILSRLLDQHGTGRVMLRNTRSTVSGFPKRLAVLQPLSAGNEGEKRLQSLAEEFEADVNSAAALDFDPAYQSDPRIIWLAKLLRELGEKKVLLICRTQSKVEEIEIALRKQLNIKMAVFHEGLSLVHRDRNATWFAEEDGARLLICSEIGSEGRNFQFAHHLVLFDLPLDPELLEQRIGRLDRIGQTSDIQIHIPYIEGSSQEVLVRWYHEGLNSFQKNLAGARQLLELFGTRIHDIARDFHETADEGRAALEHLLKETKTARAKASKTLGQGRDRLLELNSFGAAKAAKVVDSIRAEDKDSTVEEFMLAVFDQHGIHVEELAPRTYQIGSAGVFADMFPGLPPEGMTVTGDRKRALSRETVQFLTWDHPLVAAALDLLLGSEKGNCSFAILADKKGPGLLLETIYLIECIAPPQLHVDRFLPPTPIRVVVDHRGADVSATLTANFNKALKQGEAHLLLDRPELREDLLPMLLEQTEKAASKKVDSIISAAREAARSKLTEELQRLRALHQVNKSVRLEEIAELEHELHDLMKHLSGARLRLDAIRLIQRA